MYGIHYLLIVCMLVGPTVMLVMFKNRTHRLLEGAVYTDNIIMIS